MWSMVLVTGDPSVLSYRQYLHSQHDKPQSDGPEFRVESSRYTGNPFDGLKRYRIK